ncbi:saccharopine dehydrogenase family protein [Rubrivivax sp. RP6-9]|uniref:saccharopine dehydrogenase family protein n=1 Tax=Rubrivivax sp. RP6-9 TaxID=3415750 RepID=UPI003CC65841
MAKRWMIYGATGYTGALIAQECARRGLQPVLAGRDAVGLRLLAEPLHLQHVVVALDNATDLKQALKGFVAVLHCAGPFSQTSAPMREACIAAGTHYLDITGEIDVFVAAHDDAERARAAGVLLCPGVGFDVVPTDCVSVSLKAALPDATHLSLMFSGVDHLSAGTTVTSMEAIFRGTARVREDGRIIDIPFGDRSRMFDFGSGPERSFVIPWGDVATAGYSTGIDNIEVHIPRASASARAIRALVPWRRLMAGPMARRVAHPLLRRLAGGPSPVRRARELARVWGEARNAAGAVKRAGLQTLNGYSLTILTAVLAVEHVLRHEVPAGYLTPTQLMGPDCLEHIEGAGKVVLI